MSELPVYVGAGAAVLTSGLSPVSVPVPDVQEGDLMILNVGIRGNFHSISASEGWTPIAGVSGGGGGSGGTWHRGYWKRAAASEPAATVQRTTADEGHWIHARIHAWRGAAGIEGGAVVVHPFSNSGPIPQITTQGPNREAVIVAINQTTRIMTGATGSTVRYTNTNTPAMSMASRSMVDAGTLTGTITMSTNGETTAIAFAVVPPALGRSQTVVIV